MAKVESQSARMARRQAWRPKIVLLLLSTLITLLAVEVGLRVFASVTQQRKLNDVAHQQQQFVPPEGETRLGHIIRPSTNSEMIYELIPGTETVFCSRPLKVNSVGFRGRERPLVKPKNTVRILGLGDSVMFGWGVPEDETYLSLLVERLNAQYPEVKWECVNTAVPGYNTAMEAAVLESRGLAYDPDIVIVGYVPNDLGLPNFLQDVDQPWSLSRSYLVDLITKASKRNSSPFAGLDYCPVEFRSSRRESQVPAQYHHMVGAKAYETSMDRIKQLCQDQGAELLVLSHMDRTPHGQDVRRINAQLGIEYLSAEPNLESYMKDHGLKDWIGTELTYSEADSHPSAVWHNLVCDALVDYLDQRNVIQHRITLTKQGSQNLVDDDSTTAPRSPRTAMLQDQR